MYEVTVIARLENDDMDLGEFDMSKPVVGVVLTEDGWSNPDEGGAGFRILDILAMDEDMEVATIVGEYVLVEDFN